MCSYYSQDSDYFSVHKKCDFPIYIEKKKKKTKHVFHIITQDGDRNPHLLHKYIQPSVDTDKTKLSIA